MYIRGNKQKIMTNLEIQNRIDNISSILYSFAYNLTQNVEDAKDLFQETAFRVVNNKEKFRIGTNFKAWTLTIMKNIFINNYRKKSKLNTISDSTDNMYYINSGKNAINNKGESNIMVEELIHMIDTLDEGLRIPFVMHYQGYKYLEIADHLDLPLGTVKSRIFFARKELKNQIRLKYHHLYLEREKAS